MGCCVGKSTDKVEPADEANLQLQNVNKNGGSGRPPDAEGQFPYKNRSCTDVLFLLLFVMFLGGLTYFMYYTFQNGDIYRVLNGYDNCGNVCGRKNSPPSADCYGKDMTDNKYLQIRNAGEKDSSKDFNVHRECVASCDSTKYKEFLNRCIPQAGVDVARTHFTRTGLPDFIQEVAEDLDLCKMEILYILLTAFGFSLLILILFRFLVGIVVWVILIAAMIASVVGTIFLWILWKKKKAEAKNKATDAGMEERSATSYLVYAIVATVTTVIIWLVIFVMRKRIKLVVRLFKEAGKAIGSMPFVLLQPFITFVVLCGVIAVWLFFTFVIESAGFIKIQDQQSRIHYFEKNDIITAARWYNLFALFWFMQICIGCQHMVIAGAVCKWFFTRDKQQLGMPICRGYWNLVRYHIGTVILGSFLIALVQMVRAVLKFVESQTKGSDRCIMKCIFRSCQCCLWCFEKILQFFSRNAYIEVAMYGYNFCKGGQQAFKLLASNALRVAAINSVGDFVLFLGKVVVVIATVLVGIQIIDNKEGVQHKWIPLALGGVFAYLVSHCFLTVFEMAIDTIFLCFCEDCERNDGLNRPYFMSRGLMEFVHNSKKALGNTDAKSEAWSSSSRQPNK